MTFKKKLGAGLLLLLLALAGWIALSARVLTGAGEYLGMDDVVAKLDGTYGLYGPALSDRTDAYRQALYKHYKPVAAVLGSSRVLQFRAENFSVPFVNLGGLRGLDDADTLARKLFAEQAPKILILGADVWWFSPAAATPAIPPEPTLWTAMRRLSFGDIATLLTADTPDVGINAILRKDGLDRFGSSYDTSLWTGARDTDDGEFRDSLAKIHAGTGAFAHGRDISAGNMQKFLSLLDFLQSKNVKVILLLPPLAPTVIDAMDEEKDAYIYVDNIRRHLKAVASARNIPLFDFHDARSIGATDCEFEDGVTPGEIADDRMLLRMALGDLGLRKSLKLPELAYAIEHNAGHVSTNADEVDFLGIGCVKQSVEEIKDAP